MENQKLKTMGNQFRRRSWAEPWRIKAIEPIRRISKEERIAAIREAGYNTYLLPSSLVYIDLLSDSGMSGMSDGQWAGMMQGDEAYAGRKNFFHLESVLLESYGYKYFLPTHQGRDAHHFINRALLQPGRRIAGNISCATFEYRQDYAETVFHDVSLDEAYNTYSMHPFKGNIDPDKLSAFIESCGAGAIAFISVAATASGIGGQPVSMENIKAVRAIGDRYGIRVFMDASRLVENAYFIQEREQGYGDKTIKSIVKEFCSYADGAWMSLKKEAFAPTGGCILLNDASLFQSLKELATEYEGPFTYGGLTGRDMEAVAAGVSESMQDEQVHAYIGQINYLGELLFNWGIPVVQPIGSNGIFLDIKRIYPHIPQLQFPAQMFTVQLYLREGIRSMECGVVTAGRDGSTGDHRYPKLELARLAIPARVYTQAHMDVVSEAVRAVYEQRDRVRGLRMTYEPKGLRCFNARFEPLP